MNSELSKAFKAYDIRGLSPGELDAAFARRLGEVLAAEFGPKRVLVGRDMRTTSPELEAALIDGLTSQGVAVTRIGLCSTPMFNVSVGLGAGKYDLGIMVTASHNPGKYNGFKLVKGDPSAGSGQVLTPIGQGSGMEIIRDRFMSNETRSPSAVKGSVTDDPNALTAYLDKVFSQVDVTQIPPQKIAVDAGNGMNGLILPELAKRLPQCTFFALYWELDGNFPHHEANPLKTETLEDLRRLVGSTQSNLGVAFDGDGDRVGFMDELGVPIPGDLMTALLAESLLAPAPASRILYDLRSSWSTEETISSAGGIPVMCRVGHAFIKRQMRERKDFSPANCPCTIIFKICGTWSPATCAFCCFSVFSPRPASRCRKSGSRSKIREDRGDQLRGRGQRRGALAHQRKNTAHPRPPCRKLTDSAWNSG